jgi:hypothetical protein
MSARAVRRALLIALATLLPASARGQDDQFAPIVLQLPASARATGLGGAFVAVRDIESLFANPAFAGIVTGTAVSVERYSASRTGTIAASMTLGQFGVAVSTQYLDFTAAPPVGLSCGVACSTSALEVPSSVLSEHASAAASSLSAAAAISTTYKGFRWGGALKYVEQRVGDAKDAAPAFDLGVTRDAGRVTWALAVQNLGPSLGDDAAANDMPQRYTLGMAGGGLPVGPLDFGLSLALSVLRDGFVAPAGGMEWSYNPLEGYTFVVRAGARRPELDEQRPFTFGASFTFDRLSLDYAFEDISGGAGHRLGLRVR